MAKKYVVEVKFTENDGRETYQYSAETLETAIEVLNHFASIYADSGSASFREGDMHSVSIMTVEEFTATHEYEDSMPAEDCGFGETGVVYGEVALTEMRNAESSDPLLEAVFNAKTMEQGIAALQMRAAVNELSK